MAWTHEGWYHGDNVGPSTFDSDRHSPVGPGVDFLAQQACLNKPADVMTLLR